MGIRLPDVDEPAETKPRQRKKVRAKKKGSKKLKVSRCEAE